MNDVLKSKAFAIIEKTVNCLASKEYEKLSDIISVDDSWIGGESSAIQGFTEWLEEQLRMWSEDYGKEVVIDSFDSSQVVEDAFKNGRAFFEYNPTNNGEAMDFWFEINFEADGDEITTALFNVNV